MKQPSTREKDRLQKGDARGQGGSGGAMRWLEPGWSHLASEEPAHGTRLASTQIRPHALRENDAQSQTQRRPLGRMGWRT